MEEHVLCDSSLRLQKRHNYGQEEGLVASSGKAGTEVYPLSALESKCLSRGPVAQWPQIEMEQAQANLGSLLGWEDALSPGGGRLQHHLLWPGLGYVKCLFPLYSKKGHTRTRADRRPPSSLPRAEE